LDLRCFDSFGDTALTILLAIFAVGFGLSLYVRCSASDFAEATTAGETLKPVMLMQLGGLRTGVSSSLGRFENDPPVPTWMKEAGADLIALRAS
jgi:hypothetical protein